MKVIATTLGEVLDDFFSFTLNLQYVISLAITFALLVIVFTFQIKSDKFQPVRYWLVIIGTTTVGTEISDLMDRTLGLGYIWGSAILLTCLLIVLFTWHQNEKEIKVYPITEIRVSGITG